MRNFLVQCYSRNIPNIELFPNYGIYIHSYIYYNLLTVQDIVISNPHRSAGVWKWEGITSLTSGGSSMY